MASEPAGSVFPLKNRMVAVTGGIATGKSRVARYLAERSGALLLDADAVCRALQQPGEPGWQGLRNLLGAAFFLPDGGLDRPLLRQHLFADAELRGRVEALLHPLVREALAREARSLVATGGCHRLLVEVPLLFEAGWQDDYAQVVVVAAEMMVCVERLMARDRVSREAARRAIASQMPLLEKKRRADFVIDNSGAWEETCRQLEALLPFLWATFEKKL